MSAELAGHFLRGLPPVSCENRRQALQQTLGLNWAEVSLEAQRKAEMLRCWIAGVVAFREIECQEAEFEIQPLQARIARRRRELDGQREALAALPTAAEAEGLHAAMADWEGEIGEMERELAEHRDSLEKDRRRQGPLEAVCEAEAERLMETARWLSG